MDYLSPFETEYLVKTLTEIPVREYGSKAWFGQYEALYKLNLQAHRNAKAREDEYVQDSLVTFDKVRTVIYSLILSETWKTKVLPLCLESIIGLPSVRTYTLIYHEAVIANILGLILYHRTVCVEAGDYLIDLIDWCYRKLVKLNTHTIQSAEREQSRSEEFSTQLQELDFAMGIQSISIIQFISDHLSGLTLSVIQQLIEQCDIFCVLIPLMEQKPWIKKSSAGKMIFEEQHWVKSRDSLKIPKVEAQIWMTIFNLFMNPDVRSKYELNSYRKNNLLRLRKFINEVVIDQLPILGALLRSLEELSLMGDSLPSKISAFVIQQLPELQDKICYGQNWDEIAEYQKREFWVENQEEVKRAADLMVSGFEDFLGEPLCAQCGELATNRCSKCHNEWYCSRKCQVSAWKKHKEVCELMKSEVKEKEAVVESRPKIVDITDD